MQEVDRDSLESWLAYLSSTPRAAQLLDKDSQVVASLEQTMSRYLNDVSRVLVRCGQGQYRFADACCFVELQLNVVGVELRCVFVAQHFDADVNSRHAVDVIAVESSHTQLECTEMTTTCTRIQTLWESLIDE